MITYCTSNPDNGEYLVSSTDKAQQTRCLSASIKYDEKVWAEWAENSEIDSRCINFMLLNPEVVTGIVDSDGQSTASAANPRQWVNFFHTIGNIENYKEKSSISMIETVGQMAVGNDLVTTFISFIHNNMDKLIEPEYMILHENEEQVMNDIKNCIGFEKTYRSDIASLLAIRLANWLIKYSKDNSIDKKILDRVHNIITGQIFGADHSYTIAKKVYHKQRQKFIDLVSRKTFMDYILSTK